MTTAYTYILQCANGEYYVGSTTDLEHRLMEHQAGLGGKFTRTHLPVKLVYKEEYASIEQAFARERQLHCWSRAKKEALIKEDYDLLKHLSSPKPRNHNKLNMKSVKINKVYHHDARDICKYLSSNTRIQTTITSPPYFDMKDYGVDNQVGYGQKYSDYLNDLQHIFKQIYDYTKNDGTLWIIIDTFKRNNAVVPLPFDLTSQLKEIGWLLQDIIIWKKDKTVPWSYKGFVQRKFEYVLFFSKTPNYKYNRDRVRIYDTNQLKKWWVKYPERYNPKGKALDEVWEFPIPVQGSWGNEYIRHFCPLPKDMVANMISISSDENDIVLDPFSGSGTVLSQSAYMNRQYIGFELNREYINQFEAYLKKTIKKGKEEYIKLLNNNSQMSFESVIWDLRVLKYGRIIIIELEKCLKRNDLKTYVERTEGENNARYTLYGIEKEETMKYLNRIISKPPLSKFEIKPIFRFSNRKPKFRNCFFYSKTNSYSYMKDCDIDDKRVKVISNIKVDLNEKDYE